MRLGVIGKEYVDDEDRVVRVNTRTGGVQVITPYIAVTPPVSIQSPTVSVVRAEPIATRTIPISVAIEREPDILRRTIVPVVKATEVPIVTPINPAVVTPSTAVVTTPTGQTEVISSGGFAPVTTTPTGEVVTADAGGLSNMQGIVKYGLIGFGLYILADMFGSKPKHRRAGKRRTGRVRRVRRARR